MFSAFADTVKYLYDQLAEELRELGLHSAMIVGNGANKTTLKGVRVKDINDVLMNFSLNQKNVSKLILRKQKRLIFYLRQTVFQRVRTYKIATI